MAFGRMLLLKCASTCCVVVIYEYYVQSLLDGSYSDLGSTS